MEPAEAATAFDAIFKDSASASMANEDDAQLPNTLKESLASIEAEVEHAANLEHSKSGCLAAVCEKLQKAAVRGVPARGDVNHQFRRALKDEWLASEGPVSQRVDLEKCHSSPELVGADKSFKRDRLLERDVSITGSDCSRRGQRHRGSHAYLPHVCGAGPSIFQMGP